MKKLHYISNRQSHNPEENLLLAIVMGGIGFFVGFFIWFILPASFGISAIVYLLLSVLLAVTFFAFGFLQPVKAAEYLDLSWDFIVGRLKRVFGQKKDAPIV